MAHHYCAVSHPNEAIGFLRCLLANEHVFLIIKKMWTVRVNVFVSNYFWTKCFAVCTIFIQSMKRTRSHKDTVWPSYFFALYLFSELYVKELKKWNSDIFFSAEWSFDSTFTCANKIVSFRKNKKENRLRCAFLVVFIFCKLSWHWPWHEKDETTVTEQSAILSNSASYVSEDHLVPIFGKL